MSRVCFSPSVVRHAAVRCRVGRVFVTAGLGCPQGEFVAAAIIQSPPEPITEAVPRALSTAVQVVVARRCGRGDVLRVTLPEGAVRDSAGAALAAAASAESVCHGDSLQDVPSVHHLLTAVGAVAALAALIGTVATGLLLWRVIRDDEGHQGALQVGGSTITLLLLCAHPPSPHSYLRRPAV